jgi:hypothetical protein
MNIDRERLRADIDALARDCRALKDILRATWTRPMADEQRKLVRLRWRATELCVLAARMRGRHHVVTPPRALGDSWDQEAWHAAIVERVAKDYAIAELVVAEGAAR